MSKTPMSSRFHAILLFGYPGAGKGTQGDRLGSRKGFFHLATGDVFRSLDPDSEHGREFQYYAAKGLLVPDSLTMAIFRSYLYNQIAAERYQPEEEMLLLDGIPRSVEQARILQDLVEVSAVLHLKASDLDVLADRIVKRAVESKREDDADTEVIHRRFRVYEEQSMPVLACYDSTKIHELDALLQMDEVTDRINGIVDPIRYRIFPMH